MTEGMWLVALIVLVLFVSSYTTRSGTTHINTRPPTKRPEPPKQVPRSARD